MKHRAIKDLSQLSDSMLLQEVSEGLKAIHDNCIQLYKSAKNLIKDDNFRASKIIEAVAKEEAAKYLILLDALRCPKKDKHLFSKQLSKFNEHLAKGIYAETYGLNFNTYQDVCNHIKRNLREYYLDGPMEVDFICRNSIIANREQCFYVDYVKYEDEYHWISPNDKHLFCYFTNPPIIITLVEALHKIGIDDVATLKRFSIYWRDFVFDEKMHFQDLYTANSIFFSKLKKENLLKIETTEKNLSLIADKLLFPLYKESMAAIKVDQRDLEKTQKNWSPDYHDQQGGI